MKTKNKYLKFEIGYINNKMLTSLMKWSNENLSEPLTITELNKIEDAIINTLFNHINKSNKR